MSLFSRLFNKGQESEDDPSASPSITADGVPLEQAVPHASPVQPEGRAPAVSGAQQAQPAAQTQHPQAAPATFAGERRVPATSAQGSRGSTQPLPRARAETLTWGSRGGSAPVDPRREPEAVTTSPIVNVGAGPAATAAPLPKTPTQKMSTTASRARPPAKVPAAAPSSPKPLTPSATSPAAVARAVTQPSPSPGPQPPTQLAAEPSPPLTLELPREGSLRQSAPPARRSARPPSPGADAPNGAQGSIFGVEPSSSIADTFATLLSDVDASFGALLDGNGRVSDRPPRSYKTEDLADVRELFAQLAANHMRQVRDFMIDVKWGEATRDWVGICEPAVLSLRRAAEKLELAALCTALDDFAAQLSEAARSTDPTITGEARERLIATHARLFELMPQAFALETDRSAREAIILQSLLLQVRDVRKVTIDKLYAAGLTTLDVMFAAKADDIAATTGIADWLAQRIVDKFQSYRRDLSSVVPDVTRSGERERLAALAGELAKLHEGYERAAAAWSPEAAVEKKHLRQARDAVLLQVKVILARLGEVDRLHAIERLPFDRKIEQLHGFLHDAAERYVPAP